MIHPTMPTTTEVIMVRAMAPSTLDLRTEPFLKDMLKVPRCMAVPIRLPMAPNTLPLRPLAEYIRIISPGMIMR